MEDKKSAFTGTSTIAGDNTKRSRCNDTQRIGAEFKFENCKSNITNKQQKSCARRQHLDEEMADCSFLGTEKIQRKGDTSLTNPPSVGRGTGRNTERDQMEIIKNFVQRTDSATES